MSVTFWVPDAPRTRVMVPCSSEIYDNEASHPCTPSKTCGYCQNGFEEQWTSPAPDLNVANETARVLLLILRLNVNIDLYGSVEPNRIADVRRSIIRALSTGLPEQEAVPAFEFKNPGATGVSFGLDAERIRDRLSRLDAVLVYAQQHAQRVSWG